MGLQQNVRFLIALVVFTLIFSSCASFPYRPGYDRNTGAYPDKGSKVTSGKWEGVISYYGDGFHGKPTANGERFDQMGKTCAHKTLPFGTLLKITLKKNNESVVVRVNDRGPFKPGRLVDLSYGAAKDIGLVEMGTAEAIIEVTQ